MELPLKSKVNFKNSDIENFIVKKEKRNSIQNFINSSFTSFINKKSTNKLGDSFSYLNTSGDVSNLNLVTGNNFNIHNNTISKINVPHSNRIVSSQKNSQFFASKKSLNYVNIEEADKNLISNHISSRNNNHSVITIIPGIGFNSSTFDRDKKESLMKNSVTGNQLNQLKASTQNNILKNSFWNDANGLQSGTSNYNPIDNNHQTQAQIQIFSQNQTLYKINTLNDDSLSYLKEKSPQNKRKFSTHRGSSSKIAEDKNLSFTMSMRKESASNIKLNTISNIKEKQERKFSSGASPFKPTNLVLSDFKKFTNRLQGEDDVDLIDINELNKNVKRNILAKDNDNNDTSIFEEEKLVGDMNFVDECDIDDELDEKICDRKDINLYQLKSKREDLKPGQDKINLHLLLKDFYLDEEIENSENNNNNITHDSSILEYNNKFKLLEFELKKMRSEKENIVEDKKLLQELKDKISREKEEMYNKIQTENQKIEKLNSIDIKTLDAYDRLRISMTEKEKEKDKNMIFQNFPINIDSFNIDVEKYLNNSGSEGKNQNFKNSNFSTKNLDEKEILLEIQKLKSRYEEKSKKYKKIIRRLKEVISNAKKSISYSYNNSMG